MRISFVAGLFAALAGSAYANTQALHVMRIGPAAPRAVAAGKMLYYAGPVIANVKAVAVIWGAHVNPTTVKQIPGFLKAITNSTFIDQLKQYDTNITGVNGMGGTDQFIGRGSFVGEYTITPKNTATRLSDAQVQTELEGQIAAGKLPAADLNTLYLIYFPRNVTITAFGMTSCVAFGAYHSSVSASATPSNVFYTVEPDCGLGFASQTVISSHELAEAVSDAIPTPGSHPAYPQAWNTSNGSEIGDLCQAYKGRLTAGAVGYSVQEVFLNSTNACGKGNFTSP